MKTKKVNIPPSFAILRIRVVRTAAVGFAYGTQIATALNRTT